VLPVKEGTMNDKDATILDEFASQYKAGVVVLERATRPSKLAARVNVYVDGLLTVMSEDTLQRLIDIGFYRVVTVRPGPSPS
jgi:hypothetical protein